MSDQQPLLKPPTRLWFGSDFHYERYSDNYRKVGLLLDVPYQAPFDYLILPGDITASKHVGGVLEALRLSSGVDIFFTPGNHEFWDGVRRGISFEEQVAEMRAACESREGITFLYNEGVDIPGTNYSLFMSPWFTNLSGYDEYYVDENEDMQLIPQSAIEGRIGDYRTTLVNDLPLRAGDHIRMNREAIDALGKWLELEVLSKGRIPIIATHFGPSKMSYHRDFPERDLVSSYFNTDYLDTPSYIWPTGSTWIHGHTHCNVDYMHPSGIRVVTNQLGYRGESSCNETFDPMKYLGVQ